MKFYVQKHDHNGDYVKCCNCGKTMVVKCGVEDCPACKSVGTLIWANDEEHVVNIKTFKERMRMRDLMGMGVNVNIG